MDFKEKTILVYGTGKSGIGAAELLAELGAKPILFDQKEGAAPDDLIGKIGEAYRQKVQAAVGTIGPQILKALDAAVLSPGVPTDIPEVMKLKEAGIPVWGEVELAFRASRGTVLAVTGTNGKTTTTSLLGEIMKAHNPDTFVAGNIGTAYTGVALQTSNNSCVVLEASSFQLETIETFHPRVSAILNITEDHLNRHHTMEEYIRCKELVTLNQNRNDVCVLNYEDPVLRDFGEKCSADVFWFSSGRKIDNGIWLDGEKIRLTRDGMDKVLLTTPELILIGTHNYENVMAAIAMAFSAGVPIETIVRVCKSFKPVEHRIEYVDEKNGVIWYNDSKGTNPDAAIKGIEAMSRPTLLIAGGYDKGSDYRGWIRSFGNHVRLLVLEGKTRFDIRDAALECGFPEEKIKIVETMHEAMDFCRDNARPGDAVLLSPACASWGEFPNYEVRGEKFKEYVRTEI
ncbi:MAG: UDP-N-acetylmuramoyl-L-alanine--D-glutamate ligase [Lachnospiraceae bacterium]|nr:UDP-N-acetylmuramoyl-L-alanine--D-glutamate ligase [Lachnospiraceae bacterium]